MAEEREGAVGNDLTAASKWKEQLSVFNTAALIAIAMFCASHVFTNASLSVIQDHFNYLDMPAIRAGTTNVSLVNMITMIIVSAVVNRQIGGFRLKYRTCGLFGMLLVAIGGVAPVFLNDWNVILIFRYLLGVGMGFINVRNGMIMLSYKDPQKQTQIMGYSIALFNLMAVLASPIDGWLSDQFGWRGAYMIYIPAVVILIYCIFFLKEPPYADEAAEKQQAKVKVKTSLKDKISPMLIVYVILMAFMTAGTYPILSGFSSFMRANGYQSAALAGTIMMFFNIAGVLCNMVLSQITKYIKGRWLFSICFAILAAGYWICLNMDNPFLLMAGVFCIGMGYKVVMSVAISWAGQQSSAENKTFTTTLTYAGTQFGNYFSNVYIAVCFALVNHPLGDAASQYHAQFWVNIALTVLFLVWNVSPDRKKKEQLVPKTE